MPINCLINSEQIVNNSCSNNQFMVNSWTIRVQTKSIRVSLTKTIRAPQKMKAALMNPFMSIDGVERGKSEPKNPTILSVFSAIRH